MPTISEPRIVVYTAIINGYDELPKIRQLPESVELYCFTNSQGLAFDATPWNTILIDNYFEDAKITSGYIKSISHILFGFNVISVWIDANLCDVVVDLRDVFENSVSVCPHIVRKTIREEAREVGIGQLLDKGTIGRHLTELHDVGFPDSGGLSATMYLIRDHRDPRVRRANEWWWKSISQGVRRDQLSFDYALWEARIAPHFLNVDWRLPNRLFSRRDHKSSVGRSASDAARQTVGFEPRLNRPELPETYPSQLFFLQEKISQRESKLVKEINHVVSTSAERGTIEGNYYYFHRTLVDRYTPADPRRSYKREYLRRAICGRKRALEIGFNAGHSAVMMLCAEPSLSLRSIDICQHDYTLKCANILERVFNDRFRFIQGDSRDLTSLVEIGDYDFVHIDGGHEFAIAMSDLNNFLARANLNTMLMFDDAYIPLLSKALLVAAEIGLLSCIEPGLPSSGENRLFIRTNKKYVATEYDAALSVDSNLTA